VIKTPLMQEHVPDLNQGIVLVKALHAHLISTGEITQIKIDIVWAERPWQLCTVN
jgi:hypothetical protein